MKHTVSYLLLAAALVSCDEHIQYPDNSLSVGDVVMSDGSVLRPEAVALSRLKPVAVVFYVNHDADVQGDGFAVWLQSMPDLRFAEALGVRQGTSSDISDFDGNANTYAMYTCADVESPLAANVFDMWLYGQSAYVPSVGQMRLLYSSVSTVNIVLDVIGGDTLDIRPSSCWYWTSTEVEDQDENKAWLYSLSSGAMQETPKTESHSMRPIITLNR